MKDIKTIPEEILSIFFSVCIFVFELRVSSLSDMDKSFNRCDAGLEVLIMSHKGSVPSGNQCELDMLGG